jgi:hypothetical protein
METHASAKHRSFSFCFGSFISVRKSLIMSEAEAEAEAEAEEKLPKLAKHELKSLLQDLEAEDAPIKEIDFEQICDDCPGVYGEAGSSK